ncbi:MAG: GLPGLI family protein [Dysgonamonadaceae bacterium]|jgi:GLPGLI family protein|nr:GLPGLI family protein [Dysgonamonadaceae bacterium]
MKKLIILCSVLTGGFFCHNSHSQTTQTVDTVKLRVVYEQFSVMDTANPGNKMKDMMYLDIGDSITLYDDYNKYVMVHLIKDLKSQAEVDRVINENSSKYNSSGVMDYKVIKNYPQKHKMTVGDRFAMEHYIYEETIETPKWILKNGTLTVAGYECKKAETLFRGRKYEAWYAPGIPINDGPWKFSGLPGLILKVVESKGEFSFECVSLEKKHEAMRDPQAGSAKTAKIRKKSECIKARQAYMDNAGAFIQGNPLYSAPLPAHNYEKKPYNPIELSE